MSLASYFTNIDSKRVTLSDDRPDWLYDAVQEAHAGSFPNDWVYSVCKSVCEAIDDGCLTDEDSVHEYADSEVDIYTKDLYQWAADMCLTDVYANAESEASDMGLPEETEKRIGVLQYCAIASIARTILSAHEDQ